MSFNYSVIILKVLYASFLSLMDDLQEVPKVQICQTELPQLQDVIMYLP